MKFVATSLAGLLLAATNCAASDKLDYVGLTPSIAAEARAHLTVVPPGATPIELERWTFRNNMFSVRPIQNNYEQWPGTRQGLLGFISYTPFEGSRTLYSCVTLDWNDTFTSNDPNCEGQRVARDQPITGYIASTQIAGTVPLYRCMRGGLQPNNWADHFDTTAPNCENVRNQVNEGIIGYIWL
ncbi:hypothetical protein JWH04_16535 [Xanthomonas melonis]|uniref:hypothetical protein n=1 Tax=Xanthomonas melonis TaxID=56456 RepID=UPI001E4E995D|nr:hypothetical protein [Xanthomonas melonis]MCD0280518.1 hypothetical protein [Xanthomonas melonis]